MALSELKGKAHVLIGKSDYEAVFELLARRLNPERPAFSDLSLLSSRYNRVFSDEMKGVVSREAANVEYARLSDALLKLVRRLEEQDLGSGGGLETPLEKLARELPVDIPLSPLYLVNCDRKRPTRTFWRAFSHYLDEQRHFQFYFLPSCSTQEPDGFSERVVYELLEKELDNQYQAFDYRRRADGRLRVEPLPLGYSLASCQKAFKKYFTERFSLANSETAFEDYLRTGLPKLPWQYVATVFKVTAPDWDQDIMAGYLQWIIDTFKETGPDIPNFLFLFIVIVKNAHREEAVRRADREALSGADAIVQANAEDASWVPPLRPVPTDDLEYWIDRLGSVPFQQKNQIITHMAEGLTPAERQQYEANKEFNMERIQDFQEKVYKHHQHK